MQVGRDDRQLTPDNRGVESGAPVDSHYAPDVVGDSPKAHRFTPRPFVGRSTLRAPSIYGLLRPEHTTQVLPRCLSRRGPGAASVLGTEQHPLQRYCEPSGYLGLRKLDQTAVKR